MLHQIKPGTTGLQVMVMRALETLKEMPCSDIKNQSRDILLFFTFEIGFEIF